MGAPAAVILEGGGGIVGVGDTVPLTARVVDAAGRVVQAASVTWRSLDTAVVRIDPQGKVIAWDAGATGVVAEVGGIADTASLRVEVQPRALSIEAIPFCCSADTAFIGGTFYFRGIVRDGRGRVLSGVPVTYTVPDTSAATPATLDGGSPRRAYTVGLGAGNVLVAAQVGSLRAERQLPFRMAPIRMAATPLSQIGIGDSFACGLDAAGRAQCWGVGDVGQLGRPDTQGQPWIAPVSGGLAFSTLEVGVAGACGISTAKRLWCWGRSGLPERASTPTAILDGVEVAQVSIGKRNDETCARTATGEVWCWGLVNGTRVDAPTRLATPGPVAEVAVGDGLNGNSFQGRYACVLSADGRPSCIGSGAGATLVEVTGAPSALRGLVAGTGFACALTQDGRAWCWGDNTSGRLGTGSTVGSSATAQAVQTTARFVRLSAGDGFACGITADGTLWCWGRTPTSQFASYWRSVPYRLSQDERFRALVPGAVGVCGQRDDGDLRCANLYYSPVAAQ